MPVVTYNGLLSPKLNKGGGLSSLTSLQAHAPATFSGSLPTFWPVVTTVITDAPVLLSAVVQDSTHIKATFVSSVVNNNALQSPVSYSFDPPLTVYAVTPEAVTRPTYVVLTTAEILVAHVLTLVRLKKG